MPLPHSNDLHTARHAGFTLLEMLLVIGIMAFIAVVVAVQVVGSSESAKVAVAGKELMAALRYTRGQAVYTRQSAALVVDLEKKSYTAADHAEVILPDEMEVKMYTGEVLNEKSGAIRFYPDGGSTGGKVTLMAGGREWTVRVGWLTGDIDFIDSAKPRAMIPRS